MLPAPGFHHLHLNAVDPDAAIDFYAKQFPTSSQARWGGLPALTAPNNVLILFTKVPTAPATSPQTAIWHFGWQVTDSRARLETYQGRLDVELSPLYTGDGGDTVLISSDTWPGTGGALGRTQAQITDAKTRGMQPTRTGGFAYMRGPDHAIVEYAGNHPAERFNHVHLYQEDPFCAQLWYQQYLHAPVYAGHTSRTPLTEATCQMARGPDCTWPALEREGMFRTPGATVAFGDVAWLWYMRQGDRALVSSREHVADHIALSTPPSTAMFDGQSHLGLHNHRGSGECGTSAASFFQPPCGTCSPAYTAARTSDTTVQVARACPALLLSVWSHGPTVPTETRSTPRLQVPASNGPQMSELGRDDGHDTSLLRAKCPAVLPPLRLLMASSRIC